MNIMFKRPDGTFVIEHNGFPYHVLQDDPMYESVLAHAEEQDPPFEPAPAETPLLLAVRTITPRQLRLWLLSKGISRLQVEALLSAIPDMMQREAALIEWEYASVYERDHPLLAQLGAALGFTPEQIEAGFEEASRL